MIGISPSQRLHSAAANPQVGKRVGAGKSARNDLAAAPPMTGYFIAGSEISPEPDLDFGLS
jgi:hypothetical protein